ncbi:MAG TPA: hypothetical protein VH573_11595 [Mycobacteriales bacterium]|jgi:hypothetical protein
MPTTRGRHGAAGAAMSSVLLSAVLLVAAVVDQAGGQSLVDHAAAVYAPHGKDADPNLLYGLVYTVAVVDAVLSLLVFRAARARWRSASVLAVTTVVATGALAALLLATTEYGAQIFPAVWGVLALLPPAAGVVTSTLLLRRR